MKTQLTIHAGGRDVKTLRELDRRDRMHGYTRVGCHYLVHPDGRWEETGRALEEPCLYLPLEKCRESVGVCLVGTACTFTDDQRHIVTALHSTLYPDLKLVSCIKGVTFA